MSQDLNQPIVPIVPPVAPVAPPAAPGAPAHGEQTFPASYVHEVRQEAAQYRTKLRQAEDMLKEFEPFKEKATKLEAQNRELRVGSALSETFTKLGVNAKLTRALLRDELGSLDPDHADFSKSLNAMVKKAMEDNPELKVAAAGTQLTGAVRSGSDLSTANTTTPLATDQMSRAELAALRKAGDHEAIAKAQKEGRLKAVLSGQQ
jgi:hypothetical protein